MKTLLLSLLTFIGSHSDYDVTPALRGDLPLPTVVLDDPAYISTMAEAHVNGLYEAAADRIWLPYTIDFSDPYAQSTVLHELVHWLQDELPHDDVFVCKGHMELEAYAIQWMFQEARGLAPKPAKITGLAYSYCHPAYAR